MRPRRFDPFYKVSYYIERVKTFGHTESRITWHSPVRAGGGKLILHLMPPYPSYPPPHFFNLSYDGGFTDLSFIGGGLKVPPPFLFVKTIEKVIRLCTALKKKILDWQL